MEISARGTQASLAHAQPIKEPRKRRTLLAALLLLPLLLGTDRSDEAQIEDILQVLQVDRGLVAVDLDGNSQRLGLESGEKILHTASRGRVGFALTTRRVAAVASGRGDWRVERLRVGEVVQADPELGSRVALMLTDVRAIGFAGESGNLSEARFRLREQILQTEVTSSVAVIVTNKRALGLSAFRAGFFDIDLRPTEKNPTLKVTGVIASLVTKNRILIFDGRNGGWREQRIKNLR